MDTQYKHKQKKTWKIYTIRLYLLIPNGWDWEIMHFFFSLYLFLFFYMTI